jgi:hypothetical protein
MEGAHCFGDPACNQAGLSFPVAEYDHGQGCSITGGFVYRGTAYPRMQGVYLYADLSGGAIYEIVAPNNPPSAPSLVSPADGTTGAPATVPFEWIPSSDPEGDQVSYRFFLGTDPSFAGVVPVPVARTGSGKTADPFKGPGFPHWLPVVLFLSGILVWVLLSDS